MNGRDQEAPAIRSVEAPAGPAASPVGPSGAGTASPLPGGSVPTFPITRRRLALVVSGIFVLWLIGLFARQVGEAQTAQNQADTLRARNAAIERDIASLDREIALIKQPAFVAEMARGYLLGTPGEISFRVDPAAPSLALNAAGSQGIVPEPASKAVSPLDAWLEALFGSSP